MGAVVKEGIMLSSNGKRDIEAFTLKLNNGAGTNRKSYSRQD